MGIGKRPYTIIVRDNDGTLEKNNYSSLQSAIWHLLDKLKVINALECLDRGCLATTVNPFTGECLSKRYQIEVLAPYTVFEIRLNDKGSLDLEEITNTIKLMKEKYFERI